MAPNPPVGASVTHAVIPVAGLGTRFLPATKATPKEMLPVVDKPAIQYVVEEAAAAGLANVLMVTGRNKRPLEDHFDRNYELEARLAAKGDAARLALVQQSTELAELHYVRQGDPKGLGHAVLCARPHVGEHPFAVLLGDDLIDPRDPLLQRMIGVFEASGRSVVALMEVPLDQIELYGCAATEPVPQGMSLPVDVVGSAVAVTGLVEKPPAEEAPSNLAIIGRYVLHPAIFDVLSRTPPGRHGEIQLTDALATLIGMDPAEGGGVLGVVFRGRRFDTGDKLDYLTTVVTLASERNDIGGPFLTWLREFVAGTDGRDTDGGASNDARDGGAGNDGTDGAGNDARGNDATDGNDARGNDATDGNDARDSGAGDDARDSGAGAGAEKGRR